MNVLLAASSVTWRKNDVEVWSDGVRAVKADGQKHGLLIKRMRPSDAGSYCVTAVNAAGGVSCRATLYIQSGETTPEPDGYPHTILT